MNPLRLTAQNLRSYPAIDFQIPQGITAVVGTNGAGKSTLLGGIELALFAEGARDLASALGPFQDRVEIALEFEHGGERYRVRRSYSSAGRGKATLDFEREFSAEIGPTDHAVSFGDGPTVRFTQDSTTGYTWVPLTRESAAETQRLIEQTLGLSRATFNASAYLAQGNSAAFPEASPSDRKALLGAILDPQERWPKLAERARSESRAAEQQAAADHARLQDREAAAEPVAALHTQLEAAELARAAAAEDARLSDQALEAALAQQAEAAAAQERQAAARAAKEAAHAAYLRALADHRAAQGAADHLQGAEAILASHALEAERIPALEQAAQEQRDAALRAEAAQEAALAAQRRAQALETTLSGLRAAEAEAARQQAHIAAHADAKCDRCQQGLGFDARAAAIASLGAESAKRAEQIAEATRELFAAQAEAALLGAEAPATVSDSRAQDLARARTAIEQHAALSARCEAWQREAALLAERETAEREAALALSAAEQAAIAAQDAASGAAQLSSAEPAREAQAAARAALEAAHARKVGLEGDLGRARQAAEDARALRRQLASSGERLDTLRLAERAFGRDGIPALIAENTCGVIEAEANRVLERMPAANGAILRLEMRTQKQLKGSAELRETLDILVSDRQSTREFLTFSGGERFRVSFALRWALARLLAWRRGASSRLLVVDEPDGLDAAGMDGLAAVLREGAGGFERVLVVSHNPLLAEAFEQVVAVESDGAVSRIAA